MGYNGTSRGMLGLWDPNFPDIDLPLIQSAGVFGYCPDFANNHRAAVVGYTENTEGNSYAGFFHAVGANAQPNIAVYANAANSTADNFVGYFVGEKSYFSGKIGIGNTQPSVKLDVNGAVNCTGGTCSSDYRWKKDIQPLNNTLDKINQLRGVTYAWRTDEFPEKDFTENRQIGVIAQEVETIYPDLIHTDNKGFKSMDYMSFTAILLEGVKELDEENKVLKQQIEALENQVAKINQLEAAIQALSTQANDEKQAEE